MYLLETDTVICESLRTTGDYAPDEKALLDPLISIGDTILDIGANDGTLLNFYKKKFTTIGCEPAQNLLKSLVPNDTRQNAVLTGSPR